MSQPYTYPRGAPITVNLVVVEFGDYDPATLTVTMALKVTYDLLPPPVEVAPTAEFTVTYYPAVDGNPAYWQGSIDATASAGLMPGSYVTDAQFVFDGSVIAVSPPQIINVSPTVTPAA